MKIIHIDRKTDAPETSTQNRSCVNCGMSESRWQGNFGKGYSHDTVIYCCLGCADGAGCGCDDV